MKSKEENATKLATKMPTEKNVVTFDANHFVIAI